MPRGRAILGDWEELGYSEEEWLSFHKSKRWRLRNPDKAQKAVDSWADRNKERRKEISRSYQLRNNYGITIEDYDNLLVSQSNRCAICNTDKPTGKWKVFAVDHCHTTGNVRGLLCNECNRGMGLLGDNPERLRLAAEYLENHKIKTGLEREEKKNKS